MTFNPGKPINHSNKSHTLGFAQGGHVRLSTNVEDRRNQRPPWNQKALDVLDGADAPDTYKAPMVAAGKRSAVENSAGTKGKTPANGGIDDHLNTRQFKEDRMDFEGYGPKSGPEVEGTNTPAAAKYDRDFRPARGMTPSSKTPSMLDEDD